MCIQFGGCLFHFVVEREENVVSDRDIELVFGPVATGEAIVRVETDDLAFMAVEAGVFPSRGQARKSGLEGPAPHGLHQIGTQKKRFWVWNPHPGPEKVILNPSFDKTLGWFR